MSLALPRPARRRSPRSARHALAFHAAAALSALLFLAPIAFVVLASLRPAAEAGAPPLPPWPRDGVSLDSYARLDAFGTGILHYAGNSLAVALGTAAATVVVSVLAGYGFSRARLPMKGALFVVILSTIMIPFQSILTPLFLVLARLGLQNTLTGLVLIYVTLQLPFSVFLMRNAFEAVPKEIEEAARMEGATGLRLLVHVLCPLVFPGIVSVGLFAFLNAWNEFLAALVLMTAVRAGRYGAIDWGAVQAGVTVMMVPCLLLFLSLQRFYIRGLTAGAVK